MANTQTYALQKDRSHTLNAIDWVAMVLMIVGGLNWALVGVANFDLVATLFGVQSGLTRLVYGLVGLAALYGIYMLIRWTANNAHPTRTVTS